MVAKSLLNKAPPIEYAKVEDLQLDVANPRLPESLTAEGKPTQTALAKHIAMTTAIEDLMQAIGQNGFFPGEPLIVVPTNKSTGPRFTVVEGNRRLTALRLLANPDFIDEPSHRMREIAGTAAFKPDEIPVISCATRDEVLPYLGFRHIVGVKQWEPLAKARYMAQLLELFTGKDDKPIDRYAAVARLIGSRRDHIRRNLDALALYRLIKHRDFFNIDDLGESSIHFSILSTALADDAIARFVGVRSEGDSAADDRSTNPIFDQSALMEDRVEELTRWLFKRDDDGKTRVGESRNLRQLAMVVDTQSALEAFRNGATLSYSYRLTTGADEDLLALLYEAQEILSRAATFVANARFSDEALGTSKQVRAQAKLIWDTLLSKQQKDDDDD